MPIMEVPLNQLLSEGNIRNVSQDDPDVLALAESLREDGQKVPISVYPITGNGHYGIRFGHRRFAAASLLGWSALTAVVTDTPSSKAELIIDQYLENEQRAGLTYREKALVYRALLDNGMQQVAIARKCNVSQSDVSTALSMLDVHPSYLDAVGRGKLSPSALEPIYSLSMEDQERLFPAVMQAKTVRKVYALVRADRMMSATEPKSALRGDRGDDELTSSELIAIDNLTQAIELVEQISSLPVTTDRAVKEIASLVGALKSALSTVSKQL